ncbi:MAG: hypothetical protein ABI837_14085 [Acidobacteriota bacterium]
MKRLPLLLLFLAFSIVLPAQAWTQASDRLIVEKSLTLAPHDLKLVLDKFQPELQRGLEEAESDEGSDSHHYFVLSRSGKLRERIEKETAGIIRMIRTNQPMPAVAGRLGVLVHLVADANNPFHIANDDPRLGVAHDDYEQYFERRMSRFPTVFYGLDRNFALSPYLDKTFSRTLKLYPLMSEEYFPGGEEQSSDSFDDHSTAFGVASVCFSHAVTDLVNLYYYIWREAGGDVRSASTLQGGRIPNAH